MRILGVDTAAEPRDRGYAIVESGAAGAPGPRLVWHGPRPPLEDQGPIHVVVGERPWTVRGSKAKLTGERLITFAVNNGFQLRDAWPWAPDDPPLFIQLPVRIWKDLAIRGCAGMPGDVFCANLRQKYAPLCEDHNQLDAIGMAFAAAKIPPSQLKKYVPKGFSRR